MARSIRARVVRTQLLWSLLWGLALALAMVLAVRHEVDELLDDTLQSAAVGLIGPVLEALPMAALQLGDRAAQAGPADRALQADGAANNGPRFVWQLVGHGAENPVLASAAGAPEKALKVTPSAGFSDVDDWRVFGLALGRDDQMLYVAQSQAERSEARFELLFSVLLAGLPMLLLGWVWLRARVRHDLLPLQLLSQRLASFDPLRPGALLQDVDDEELQQVQAAIDALAARLARRVAHERAFTAHAAHALRTPLAGIDAQLAVALLEAPLALQPRLQRVRAAASRLQRVVAALLVLFRGGAEVEHVALDLAKLLAGVRVEGLELRLQDTAPIDGDADLLMAVLINLLDNAQRHGARTVTFSTPGPGLLSIHDDGHGTGAQRRLELQAALRTGDYEGRMGLGLMLADLVARAHGGALTLPEVSAGFTAVLDLGFRRRGDNVQVQPAPTP
jgi:signal transduction histidine kinase